MPRNKNAQTQDLPPPYQGFANNIPTAAIKHPYCERLVNWNTNDQGKFRIRNGDRMYVGTTGLGSLSLGLISTQAGKLYKVYRTLGSNDTKFADVSDFSVYAPASVHTITGSQSTRVVLGTSFNGHTFFFSKQGAVADVGGTRVNADTGTWTDTPYTFPAGPYPGLFFPCSSWVHKSRHYMIGAVQSDAYAWVAYSAVGGVSGATTIVDFTSIFTTQGFLVAGRSVSIADTVKSDSLCIMVLSSGEVVAYEGDYPGASNWNLVGRFLVPEPRGWNCIIDFQGDALIITSGGLISVRDLFLKGNNTAVSKGFSSPVQGFWRRLMSEIPANGNLSTFVSASEAHGTWDSFNNRLIIKFPVAVNPDGTLMSVNRPIFLVYDVNSNSWTCHVGGTPDIPRGVFGIQFYKDKVVYITYTSSGVWIKEGKTNFLDDTVRADDTTAEVPVEASLRSAPLPLSNSSLKYLTGVEMISRTDMNAGHSISLVGNIGEVQNGNVKLPNHGTNIQADKISIGLDSTFIQYDMVYDGTVTGATIGCELYAMSPVFTQGGIG